MPKTTIMVIVKLSDLLSGYGIFPAVVAGCILAGILAATMSTADSQLLAASSAFSENLVQNVFGIKLTQKQTMLCARELQLIFVPNGHKADQNVGHAEVPQAPGHHGDDADDAVGVRRSGGDVIGLREAEEAVPFLEGSATETIIVKLSDLLSSYGIFPAIVAGCILAPPATRPAMMPKRLLRFQ